MARSRNGSMRPRWGAGLVVLAVVGVFGYDGVHTALASSKAKDDANQVAHDAADYYHSHPNVDATFAQAQTEAAADGEQLSVNNFTVTSTGTVSLTLDRANSTLVLGRIHAPLDVMTGQASSVWNP